jgi:hypothetical protein
MALDPVVNFFESEIATLPVASGGTVIVLSSGDGNKLPNPSVDGAFNLTIYEEGNPFSSPEIVRATARTSDTLTVTRAQEGTTATTKTTGTTWKVVMFPTAKTIQDIDSVKLDKAGGTMTGNLTIPDKIIHSGDTDTAIRFPSDDTIGFETAGSRRVTITNTGVGIGTTGPGQALVVQSAVGNGPRFQLIGTWATTENDIVGRVVGVWNTDKTAGEILFLAGNRVAKDDGKIQIRPFSAAGTPINGILINSNGNVGIDTLTPATRLDVNGSIRASTGILFGTDTASANTLDDYEEGVWTVELSAATPFTSITYDSVRSGKYTKIGNIVICYFSIRTDAISGGAGDVSISNLPFTIVNQPQFNAGGGTIYSSGNLGAFAGDVPSSILAAVNTTRALLNYRATSNGNSVTLDVSDLDTGADKNWMNGMIIYSTS